MFKKCSQSLEKLLLFSFFKSFKVISLFSYQGSFRLFSSNSFCIISKLSSLVKNFFNLFLLCSFDFFLSRSRQLVYIITWFYVCQHIFSIFWKFFMLSFFAKPKRRRGDLNPRAAVNDLHPFQGCPFGQLGYFSMLCPNLIQIRTIYTYCYRLTIKNQSA